MFSTPKQVLGITFGEHHNCGKKKKSQPRTLAFQRARETWTFKSDFDARSSLFPVGTLATTPTPPRRGHSTHQSLGCSNWGKTDWESRGSSNPLLLPGSQSLWSQARTPGPHHWCSQSENHPAETPGASGRPRLAAPGWVRGPAGGPWASRPCCQEPARPPGWHSRPLAKTEDGESVAILSSRGWTLTAGLPEPSSLSEFKGTAPPFKNIYAHPLLESLETNSFREARSPNNPESTPGETGRPHYFGWAFQKYRHPQRGRNLEDDGSPRQLCSWANQGVGSRERAIF